MKRFFTKTLQRQILIPFLALLIIGGLTIASISYKFSVDTTTKELVSSVEQQMFSLNDTFNIFFDAKESIARQFESDDVVVTLSENEMIDTFMRMAEADDAIDLIYFGKEEDGRIILDPSVEIDPRMDARNRPWYSNAVDNPDEVLWTEPYINNSNGEFVVSAAKAVAVDGDLLGVVAIDLRMDALIEIINQVHIGETGYAALIDQKGTILTHPDPSFVGTDVSSETYFEKIKANEADQGVIEYTLEGENKHMAYKINGKTGLIVVGTVYEKELAEKGAAILGPILITLLAVILVSIAITFFITRKITKPIKQLQGDMKEIENGNLSITIENDRNDEIGSLMTSVEAMKNSLRKIIFHVSEASESMSSQSEELTQSASEVKEGSAQIASTMQELSAGTETQAETSASLSEIMDDFVRKTSDAQENGAAVKEATDHVRSMTSEGRMMMQQSVTQMKSIDAMMKASIGKVKGLDTQSKEISKLVQVIKDIAEQTNLLSLNAAIEAARAGEHGQGFAVVADEVRKLAEQVSGSVEDITKIVHNIQAESNNVVNTLEQGYGEVDAGTKQIEVTGETFEQINTSIEGMAAKIDTISSNLSEIAHNSIEMNKSIEDVAAVSEESAAGVEQVSASAQQSSSSMEEVSNSAGALAEIAEELNEQVRKFKL
ncbi:methyl-accepting chemotaxis protein [Thalassobacillus hwangdonensis]|uniref:Methyl-accepting chemotaxis protein n=1 Tax=Thalassobacillus hwangdonensis TaxID=546108 RepID=A0ABW3L0I5_9BACI